jgi:integrase
MRITKTFVDKLAPPPFKDNGKADQQFHRDSALPGFGVRVTSHGAVSFIVEKRVNGKVKRITLGRYGHLTVEQARNEAQQVLSKIARGRDPIAEKREKRIRTVTLGEAFDDYVATRKDLKASTIHDYRRSIDGPFESWKSKQLIDITKDMVELKHRELSRKSPARANNAMRVLRAIFNHAMKKHEDAKGRPIIPVNPVDRLQQLRAWNKIERRQTLLKSHQLKPWYDATLQLNHLTTRDYLHFILLTGLRRSEASHLTWDAVDYKDKTFTIHDTKNSQPHTLPLSDFLDEMLRTRYAERENNYVFHSKFSKQGYLVEPRTALARITELSGVSFTLHDLRRTFITIAESLDIPAYALKRLLNHKDPNDVTAGYIISDVERLREPMQRVTDFIVEKISDSDE